MSIIAQYKVVVIESERGCGQKVDEVKYFDSKAEADEFVKEHNAQNKLDYVPDIYWRACEPVLVEMPKEKA